MTMRLNKGTLLWDLPEYTISWCVERASWTLYDKTAKVHHQDIQTLGLAFDKLEKLNKQVPTIGLIACCKTKLATRTVAERLYASDLFKKAAAYCAKTYDRWFILSAKYGLVCPGQLVEPYEETLVGKSQDEQRAWAGKVVSQLRSRSLLIGRHRFFVHAGQDYSRFLVEHLPVYELPLRGLGIGEQKAWYLKAGKKAEIPALAGA